jgi:hypothetical protein
MAHYAFIDSNNIVVEVIVGVDEDEIVDGITDWEKFYESQRPGLRCLRTSYNTISGQHIHGGVPFRGNYAGIGFFYDDELDAFIPPKPFDSWILNTETFDWYPPIERPEDDNAYLWDETTVSWILYSGDENE